MDLLKNGRDFSDDSENLSQMQDEKIQPQKNDKDRMLDRKELAEYLSVSPNSIAVWDCMKTYDLKPFKIGRFVRYRLSVIDNLIQKGLVLPKGRKSYPRKKSAKGGKTKL